MLALLASAALCQTIDDDLLLQKHATEQAVLFESSINLYNQSVYERKLIDLARNMVEQNAPAQTVVNPARVKCTLKPNSLTVDCQVTQDHVSAAKLSDYLPKPPPDAVGYPVGGRVSGQAQPVYYDIGKETHFLTEPITVNNRTFIYYALSIFNRCWLDVSGVWDAAPVPKF